MKKEIIKYMAILVAFVVGGILVWFLTPTHYVAFRDFTKTNERYVGWDMPCNYTRGSNSDSQEYLDCGNGNVYKKIGISPSVTYFDPKDEKTNRLHCTKNQVATFTYENPITREPAGQFAGCMNW